MCLCVFESMNPAQQTMKFRYKSVDRFVHNLFWVTNIETAFFSSFISFQPTLCIAFIPNYVVRLHKIIQLEGIFWCPFYLRREMMILCRHEEMKKNADNNGKKPTSTLTPTETVQLTLHPKLLSISLETYASMDVKCKDFVCVCMWTHQTSLLIAPKSCWRHRPSFFNALKIILFSMSIIINLMRAVVKWIVYVLYMCVARRLRNFHYGAFIFNAHQSIRVTHNEWENNAKKEREKEPNRRNVPRRRKQRFYYHHGTGGMETMVKRVKRMNELK